MPASSAAAEWCRRAYGAVSLAVVLLIAAALWAPLVLAQEVPELRITSTNDVYEATSFYFDTLALTATFCQ